MKITHTTIAAASLLLSACLPSASAGAADYAVKQRIALGDASRYDYLDIDPVRHRLFLSRGDHVQVLDLPSGQPAGEIANTAGVHGIAFAQDLKLGFTSNGRANTVTVFDLDTLKAKQEVKISGVNPDAILYEPTSHKLYTFNGKSNDVTVLDARTMQVVATIKVSGKPEFAAADGGRVFVNIEDKGEIAVLDVATDKVVASWPLKGCDEPSGLALDRAHARLFSVCGNKAMIVTDAKTGRQVANLAIGEHPDAAAYDAASATVYASNGGGTLSVIHQIDADHYQPAQSVVTEKGARTMALDSATRTVYLPLVSNKVFTLLVVAP